MKRLLWFLVLVLSFLVLVLLTIWLWQAYNVNGEDSLGLLAYFLGLFVIPAVIIGLFVLLASHLHISHISPKVLDALRDALNQDKERDPLVRYKVAVGLSELDMEESSHHYKHDKLDDILIHTLQQDRDPRVRSKAAEGLTEVELEPFTHHKHNQLEDALLDDMAQAYKQK